LGARGQRSGISMDKRRQLMIRNILGLMVLAAMLLVVLAWLGVFEGRHSDEAQIRELMERAQREFNNHNWDNLLLLCHLTPQERDAWRAAIPEAANRVVLETFEPMGFISVPADAAEYQQEVLIVGRVNVPLVGSRIPAETVRGTMNFVRVDGRWRIDINRSAATFPYVPRP
jgi:hypothetical protein